MLNDQRRVADFPRNMHLIVHDTLIMHAIDAPVQPRITCRIVQTAIGAEIPDLNPEAVDILWRVRQKFAQSAGTLLYQPFVRIDRQHPFARSKSQHLIAMQAEIILPGMLVHHRAEVPRDVSGSVRRAGIEYDNFIRHICNALQAPGKMLLLIFHDHTDRQQRRGLRGFRFCPRQRVGSFGRQCQLRPIHGSAHG